MSYTLAYTGAEIDALLGKIDAIFVAEYGSTIYSEVTAAIAAGNKVIVANAGKVYVYAGQDDNGGYVFTQSGPNAAKPNATYVTLSTGNVWSTNSVDLATLQQFYASLMEDTASGSIASFPDGAENVPVKEMTAEIEPIQDLHGYSNPWPAGGGKNKVSGFTAVQQGTGTITDGVFTSPSVTGTYATIGALKFAPEISLTNGQTIYLSFDLKKTIGTGSVNSFSLMRPNSSTSITASYSFLSKPTPTTSYQRYSVAVTATADETAGVVYFQALNATDAVFVIANPMISTEADATFAPYSNICPISGYTGAEIDVIGFNLCSSALTNSVSTPYANALYCEAELRPNTTYCISFVGANNNKIYCNENLFTAQQGLTCNGARQQMIVTTKADIDKGNSAQYTPSSGWRVFKNGNTNTVVANFTDVCINFTDPDRNREYVPYNPDSTTYSVDWTDEAGTVYEGELNATTGELTVTHKLLTMTGSNWQYSSVTHTFYKELSDPDIKLEYYNEPFDGISDAFAPYYDSWTSGNYVGYYNEGVAGIRFSFPALNGDTAAFGTAVNGVEVIHPLKTPTVIQLDPVTVKTLLGDNNIFSSTGDVSVRYRCNTALYIAKKLGE